MADGAPQKKGLSLGRRVIRVLASLKLAVVIMVVLTSLLAWGTIVESMYDALAARKIVYDSIWMEGALLALATSLIAVMVDRWPWKVRHTPFVLAHIGILLIMLGSVLTVKFGLDGIMSVEIGKTNRFVTLPSVTDLVVTASFDGAGMTRLHEQEVDFFRRPPAPEKPVRIATDAGEIAIVGYKKYALPSREVVKAETESSGAGLRFQIQNDRVNVVEWITQRRPGHLAEHDFGPAKLFLGPLPAHGKMLNEIYLEPRGDKVGYAIYGKEKITPLRTGVLEEGSKLSTGWMGLELRILRYLPKAREEWKLQDRERPTPLTTSAVLVLFQGREHWLVLNDTLRLFTERAAYYVSYLNRPVDLGFPLLLEKFEMVPYAGTNKAMEYRSIVRFDGGPSTEISMNEPAVTQGLTFYQASFQNDDQGRPVASVFSVNMDPGRWLKYLGSLIMTLGIIALFYFRHRQKKAPGGTP